MLVIGVMIGFVVGILPGLGGSVTMAMMLPYVIGMEPLSALALLLGVHSVTATTGDITSITFGIPGEGISAAVVADGHSLAKQGEAARAVSAALASSLVGALFGAMVLALAIPVVQPLVLMLGTPEYLMLMLLGICYVAAVSGKNVIKGLLLGLFGFAISMVGLDPIDSIPRYTMEALMGFNNSLLLWDGIHLVSVTLGLFAVPEIMELMQKKQAFSSPVSNSKRGLLRGIQDTVAHWKIVLRCSAIGTYIGILPGLGGSVAQWVAYGHAAQTSKNSDQFGQGAIEGVLGPAASNNSKEGGSLIPTVAFGIPGSLGMAILLGAFILLGIVPGPGMLDPDQNLSLTFSFVWIIVITNILAVGVAYLAAGQILKLTRINPTYLVPALICFILIGGYGIRNSAIDVIIILIFGLLGWIFKNYHWPRPPLLLGLVLGGLIENKLFLSLNLYGWEWLGRPGVMIIMVMMFWVILRQVYQRRTDNSPRNTR